MKQLKQLVLREKELEVFQTVMVFPQDVELSVLENCRIDLGDRPRRQLGFSCCSDGFLCTLRAKAWTSEGHWEGAGFT